MSRSPLLLMLALLGTFACTPRGSDTEVSAKPEVSEPIAESPGVEANLAVPPASSGPVSGFVLYTEDRTVVVPTDGSPLVVGEGLWLQDDRSSAPAFSHTLLMTRSRAALMGLPRCSSPELAGACEDDSAESRRFDGNGRIVEAPPQPCSCLYAHEPLSYPEDLVVTSLIGGWLLYQGWEYANIYDGAAFGLPLIEAPQKLSSAGMRSFGCHALPRPHAAAERSWPIDARAIAKDCESEDYESEVFLLRRGDLWEVRDTLGEGGSTRWYLKRSARADSCPSSNDPCGDPQPYRVRARLDREQREYWIATDGSAALTAERHAYTLWLADASAGLDFELATIDASTDLIGARFHADIGPLRALIGKHPQLGLARP